MIKNNFINKLADTNRINNNPLSSDNVNNYKNKPKFKEIMAHNEENLEFNIITIGESKKLPYCKLINSVSNKEIDLNDKYILLSNNNIKPLNKNMIFLDFNKYQLIKIYGNKTSLGLRYNVNDKFIIDQIVTNKNIELFFSYIDEDIFITIGKIDSNETKQLKKLNPNDKKPIIKFDKKFKIYENKTLSTKTKEMIILNLYTQHGKFLKATNYWDLFNISNAIYRKTIDVNYVKGICNFTYVAYSHMIEERE